MKIRGYRMTLLAEAMWYLLKWDRAISKQAFHRWQHHLNSAPLITSDTTTKATPSQLTELTEQKLTYTTLQDIQKHIDLIVRRSPKAFNCMRRCLALKSMIERRGAQCRLHIGIKLSRTQNTQSQSSADNTLAAHAWISANEKLINDSHDVISQYQEITHESALFSQTIKYVKNSNPRVC